MANGLLLGRNPAQAPPFPPPTSYGVNRIPQRKPLDPEKLLDLGLDLISRAQDQTTKACDLLKKLDNLARMNRDRLDDEDIVKALTDLREDAEVPLERGFHSFDVALEIMTRLRRPTPEFRERVTEDSATRWRACFQAMAGVYSRAYIAMHEMVIATPTCGDLSHIPPKLHFDQPAEVITKRYHHRQSAAELACLPLVLEYWRWRLVKGVETGVLPGNVVTRKNPPQLGQRNNGSDNDDDDNDMDGGHGDTTWDRYNTSVQDMLLELAGPEITSTDFGSYISMLPSSNPNTPNPVRTLPAAHDITEDSIDNLVGTPAAASTPKRLRKPAYSRLGLLSKATHQAQASASKPRGVQDGTASAGVAAADSETRAQETASSKRKLDSNAPEPASKKTKLDDISLREPSKRKPGGETDGAPARKRIRGPGMIVMAVEGQNMEPLTNEELALLPWNKNKPAPAEADPRKYVNLPARTPSQGIYFLTNLREWAQFLTPEFYLVYEGECSEDSVVAGGGDAMDVEEAAPTGPVDDTSRTMVGQGPSSEAPQTPSRQPPEEDPKSSPRIATPRQFDDSRDLMPPPPRPTHKPSILSSPLAGQMSSPGLPPPTTTTPPRVSKAPPRHIEVEGRDGTPGIYKQFGPNTGIFSPQLPSSRFNSPPPKQKPASPKITITTEEFEEGLLPEQESSSEVGISTETFLDPKYPPEEESSSEVGITTESFLDPKHAPDQESSPGPTTTPSKPPEKSTSASSVATPGGDSYASPTTKAVENLPLSPSLPPPGGKPDTLASTKAPGRSSSHQSGLFASTFLDEHGLPKGPVDVTSEDQEPSSSEPTAGASKTPDESGSDESGRIGDGSTIYHSAQQRPVNPPQKPSPPDGSKDPPSGGSGKTDASIDSATGRAIEQCLQDNLDELEEKSRREREYIALLKLAQDAGLDYEGRTAAQLRDNVAAMQKAASDRIRAAQSAKAGAGSKTKGEAKEKEGEGEKKEGEDKNKGAEKKKGKKDDAYWMAKSDAQPKDIGEQEAANGQVGPSVWEL